MMLLTDKIAISVLVVAIFLSVIAFILYYGADAKNITTNNIWIFLTFLTIVFFICCLLIYTSSYIRNSKISSIDTKVVAAPIEEKEVRVIMPANNEIFYNKFKCKHKYCNKLCYKNSEDSCQPQTVHSEVNHEGYSSGRERIAENEYENAEETSGDDYESGSDSDS